MSRIAVRLEIEGRVQGVGFRWWTVRQASALGLSGWVRNRRDGSVEALAIGETKTVEAFVADQRERLLERRLIRALALAS